MAKNVEKKNSQILNCKSIFTLKFCIGFDEKIILNLI